MSCVNCQEGATAYTLTAHVGEVDADVDLPFCSTECLDEWV